MFHVTFASAVAADQMEKVRKELSHLCDEVILLPSRYLRNSAARAFHKAAGFLYSHYMGLKRSNYVIGHLEFAPSRVAAMLDGRSFDCVLFEYWHAAGSAAVLRNKGIPCVLDMHDLLWKARARQLDRIQALPKWHKRWALNKYKTSEEDAWKQFDAIIAINREEQKYVETRVPQDIRLFYAPMGINLTQWPYSWEPARPMRVAYYGGLGSPHNQQDALTCFNKIMPAVWQKFPEAQLWIVGSNPPEHIRALESDPRVRVTGYVENVQEVLRTMSAVVCPWSGTYGFRSRLIEVMATGVPVVASPDAVFGMELEEGNGLFLGADDNELAGHVLRLLENPKFAGEQSQLAREQVDRLFSYDNTYMALMDELSLWLRKRGNHLQ
jgi:glycosyltransferase involved in cell wall biosynthesis